MPGGPGPGALVSGAQPLLIEQARDIAHHAEQHLLTDVQRLIAATVHPAPLGRTGEPAPALHVGAELVGGVAARLELEGAVLDGEVTGQAVAEPVEELGGASVDEHLVVDHDMHGEDVHA